MPRVSVIIPTYNTAKYITGAVESVLTQTFHDLETIVVDDGSTDNTRDVLTPYMDRIQYIVQDNKGRSEARNRGIQQAQGEFIAFLDADDLWLPEKLGLQVTALDTYEQAVLTYGLAQTVDGDGHPISFWGSGYLCGEPGGEIEIHTCGPEILYGTSILPTAVLVRKKSLEQVGLFDPHLSLGEDWDMWIRLTQLGPFVKVPQVICQYRAYSREKELQKRTSDDLVSQSEYIIQKAVELDRTGSFSLIQAKALGMIYTSYAFASYESGDMERAKRLLLQALRLSPALFEEMQLIYLLEDHARRILHDTGDEASAIQFLTRMLDNLPPGIRLPRAGARRILSRAYLKDAFRAYAAGKPTNQVLWAGIRLDSTWLRNRGVLSIAIRSLFRN